MTDVFSSDIDLTSDLKKYSSVLPLKKGKHQRFLMHLKVWETLHGKSMRDQSETKCLFCHLVTAFAFYYSPATCVSCIWRLVLYNHVHLPNPELYGLKGSYFSMLGSSDYANIYRRHFGKHLCECR